MKKSNSLILWIAFIFMLGGACSLSGTPANVSTETAPASPEPGQVNPSVTPPADMPATSTPEIPATSEPNAPPELGSDRFWLKEPPVTDDRIGQMKFRLMELGYLYGEDGCGIASSYFTAATDAAVRLFQAVNGLEADGIVGPMTWEALFEENPIPAPVPEAGGINVEEKFQMQPGAMIAMDGKQIWVMDPVGMITTFEMNGEFGGFYLVQALAGEENYQPAAIWFDGNYLWIAQQGHSDGLLQAYDPDKSNPVEALLKPVFNTSIHFPAQGLYEAMAFDGTNLWLVTENLDNEEVRLQPVNLNNRKAGTAIRVGMSSDYASGYSLAFDGDPGVWVVYGDEVFGEQAVFWVNTGSGEIGQALSVCGRQVASDGSLVWVANGNNLWAVNSESGEIEAWTNLPGMIMTLYFDGKEVFALTEEGVLYRVKAE